eukprot:CAMPEP_0116946874 /NCGR_PEP_ID=MMETSP0467-20121206/37287_1 /TAXON_ID=283647 /ORGANISM="Mesodinium pulex, Strain SPMC105" /LENGTH=54 /DNA_ID=CAMNT_0004630819 /DNA_START=415 /DNA_END=579 /DNA_ORIENTATION=+
MDHDAVAALELLLEVLVEGESGNLAVELVVFHELEDGLLGHVEVVLRLQQRVTV